jgi:hypothetical protein
MFGSMGRTREHLDKGKCFFFSFIFFYSRLFVFLNGSRTFSSKSINVVVLVVVYLSDSCEICHHG